MCEEGKLTKSLQKRAVTPCVHACGGYYTPVHRASAPDTPRMATCKLFQTQIRSVCFIRVRSYGALVRSLSDRCEFAHVPGRGLRWV